MFSFAVIQWVTSWHAEAVAATISASVKPVDVGSPAQVVRLGPGRIVLSGTQMAFGQEDGDLRLAFGRLDKALETSEPI